MEKVKAWLDDFKGFFSSEISKISAAQVELTQVKAELMTANAAIAERDTKISTLTASLETAQNEVNKAGGDIKSLTEKLAAAETKARDVIAEQGLEPGSLPPGSSENAGAKSTGQEIDALRKKLQASTNPKEKFTLSNQIRALIEKKN